MTPDPARIRSDLRKTVRKERWLRFAEMAVICVLGGAAVAAIGAGRIALALAAGLAAGSLAWRSARRATRPAEDIVLFLDGVRNRDVSATPARAASALGRTAQAALAQVQRTFRELQSSNEAQALYFKAVVRHVRVGILAYRDDAAEGGTMDLFNAAAIRLLSIPRPRTLGDLERTHPELGSVLRRSQSGARTLVRVADLTLMVDLTRFHLRGEPYTLASLQDIGSELDGREIDAWQKLTRVLTHEISNSVTPIGSLASTAAGLVRTGGDEASAKAAEALAVIERRCVGLNSFVSSYKTITDLPAPKPVVLPADEVLGRVVTLLEQVAADHAVTLQAVPSRPGLTLLADEDLLEQALINLVLNAVQAAAGLPGARVVLSAGPGPAGRGAIDVADNGPGILPEVQEQVFVPFFSTRAGGNGVGLSLSRQILRLHGGTLRVRSEPGTGATFRMEL